MENSTPPDGLTEENNLAVSTQLSQWLLQQGKANGADDTCSASPRAPQTMLGAIEHQIEGAQRHIIRLQEVRQRIIRAQVGHFPEFYFSIYGHDDNIPF